LVRAQETGHSKEKQLVVFSETAEGNKMATFFEVIEAYLGKYDIRLLTHETEFFPSETIDQIGIARQQIESMDSTGALWIDFEKQTVNILVIRQGADRNTVGGEQILTRSFPNLEEGWRAECEAMAAFVRFALSSWLEEPIIENQDDDLNYTVQALDDERPWRLAETQEETETVPFSVFSASASYTAIATHGFDPIQQGASIRATITFSNMWTTFLGVDILNYYDPPNSEDVMHRLPLFVGVGIFWGSSEQVFGLNLAFETDVVYLSTENGRTFHRYNPGLDIALIIRSKISAMLALFITIGANTYLDSFEGETEGNTIYRQFQPQLCIGLEVWRFWKSDE
jgi:hypothetical protein